MQFGIMHLPLAESRGMVVAAKLAEKMGYDFFWLAEELPPYGLCRDIYVVLSHIALNTSRITVGPGVTHPYTRHPAVTANAIASLDEISGGRSALMVGLGGELGYESLGIEFLPNSLSVMRETIQICKGLFSGQPLNYDGYRFKIRNTRLTYPCRPNIPVIIAARGLKMMNMGGMYADGACLAEVPAEYVPFAKKHFEEGLKKAGRKMPNYMFSVNPLISLARTWEEARKPMDYLMVMPLASSLKHEPILESVGLTKEDIAPAMKIGIKPGTNYAKLLEPEVAETIIKKFTLCGTADDIIERIREYEKAGATSLELTPVEWPITALNLSEQIRLVGKKVLPSLNPKIICWKNKSLV